MMKCSNTTLSNTQQWLDQIQNHCWNSEGQSFSLQGLHSSQSDGVSWGESLGLSQCAGNQIWHNPWWCQVLEGQDLVGALNGVTKASSRYAMVITIPKLKWQLAAKNFNILTCFNHEVISTSVVLHYLRMVVILWVI